MESVDRLTGTFTSPGRRSFAKNLILSSLSSPDLAAIDACLEPVILKARMLLQEPKKPVEHVYFIESGVVSMRVVGAGSSLEVAMVGHGGAIGTSSLLGGLVSAHQSIVLLPGAALRVHIGDLQRVMSECAGVREHLSRYTEALAMHCAQTGLCGVRHTLEQRLACWLSLACDASGRQTLPVTHDHLSNVLGLRRAGVTKALLQFEREGIIRKMRGVLEIEQADRLHAKACRCYRIISSTYEIARRSRIAECCK